MKKIYIIYGDASAYKTLLAKTIKANNHGSYMIFAGHEKEIIRLCESGCSMVVVDLDINRDISKEIAFAKNLSYNVEKIVINRI